MGSPPPAGSKNDLLKFRSVSSMVILPAKIGRDSSSMIVVIAIAHTNSGTCSGLILGFFMLMIVAMKLIDLMIEEIPATWREKIMRSIDFPV